jgi:hypothetical protein
LEAVDILVTDQPPPARLAIALRDANVDVRVAAGEQPDTAAR